MLTPASIQTPKSSFDGNPLRYSLSSWHGFGFAGCWLKANVSSQGGGVVKVTVSGRGSLGNAVGTWCSIEVSMVV